jgi:hypothetical protein
MWLKPDNRNIPAPRSRGTLYRARQRLPWPADRDFRILAIDGGGIRGILPLALLARLERTHLGGGSVADCFDLVVGTSTGGIIALGLGAGLTAVQLFDLYMDRGGEVFPDHNWSVRRLLGARGILFNRCNRRRLDRLIEDILGERHIWESRVRLCIPAAETRHFEPFIFKTPHHPDYRLDWKEPMALAAKTTSAAPTFFAPVGNGGYEFVDGGIWANNPTMVGVADALACFHVPREQIRVLSLGCVRSEFEMSWARRRFGGLWFWRSVFFEAMHVDSQNVVGQARLIVGGDRVIRADAPPVRPPIELWNWARSRAELPIMGDRLFDEHGDRIGREFLAAPADGYSPFYTPTSAPPSET